MTAYALRVTGVLHGSIQGAAGHHSLGERLFAWINLLSNRRRERLALANLDSRLLDDIGLDYAQARMEFSKSIWQG